MKICYLDADNVQRERDATAEEIAEVEARQAAPPPVPQAVSMRQARLALLGAGMLATVNSTISGMTGAAGEAARIEWEYSGEVQRHKQLVASLGPALGLTDAQLDQLFITAATL